LRLLLKKLIDEGEVKDFHMFLYELWHADKKYLLNNDILIAFERFCEENDKKSLMSDESGLFKLFKQTPEIIISDDYLVLIHRYQMARYNFYRIRVNSDEIDQITTRELLEFKNRYARPDATPEVSKLHLDFMPFYDYAPNIKDVRTVGKGVDFLNKYMSSSLFRDSEKWHKALFEFLTIQCTEGRQLLINPNGITNSEALQQQLDDVLSELSSKKPRTSYKDVAGLLQRYGFEPGWGHNVKSITETMDLLLDLFQSPDSEVLSRFITRIPMLSKVAVISPHGWFGQENVLGRPDTGGQVVYVLDQVRALEKEMQKRLEASGLDIQAKVLIVTRLIPENDGTTCNIRLEKINQSQNSYILRVPFRDEEGHVVPHWISRFRVWPFMERYAKDAAREIGHEFQGSPDLVVGNYSDGNLVATLLSEEFDITQCNIAHALEKNKYLFSDLYWQNFENEYHFSVQHLVDLIAMNMADFIVTSTYQEIVGSPESIGQYESYMFFTMPGFMDVRSGVNLFHPRYNVVPPGVDDTVYFSYLDDERRLNNQKEQLTRLLFEDENADTYGSFSDGSKIPIFTMARLDTNKNITGLVEAFGQSEFVRERCNLIVIAGKIREELSGDHEEIQEIRRMYELIQRHNLDGQIRWLGMHLPKEDAGEIYRIIADHRGVFVQPGLFEGFGLTVLEAMSCGLPTFATHFGGPSEIIINGESGFLINPTMPELINRPLEAFLTRQEKEKEYWEKISKGGVKRVQEHFTWKLYSEKMLNLAALYSFWRYSAGQQGKEELSQYCHLLFQLLYKPRATNM